jgi:hypothetical protein
MKRILLFVCFFAAFSFAKAQDGSNTKLNTNKQITEEDDDSEWLQNRIGLYGSFFSGYGLSYQYQFTNGLSVKSQLFAYGSNDDNNNYNSDEIRLAFGMDLQYNLKRTKRTRLYALVGSFVDYNENGTYTNVYPSTNKDFDIERYFNVGIGFGIELMAWRNVSFVIEGGYYGRFGNNDVTVYRYANEQETNRKENVTPRTFGFGGGGGIFYAF